MTDQSAALHYILDASFRSNPNYELVLFDHLSHKEKVELAGLWQDPDLYGVLRPHTKGLVLKSVSRETALLFFTLQVVGSIPAYWAKMYGASCNDVVAKLVLDGMLEIEWEHSYVCGVAAHRVIFAERTAGDAGAVGRVSIEALKYVQTLRIQEASELSAQLYGYNRLPLTPYWLRTLGSDKMICEYLGLTSQGPSWVSLNRDWSTVRDHTMDRTWRMWKPKHKSGPSQPQGHTTYKLYASPLCDYLPEVFRAMIDVAAGMNATGIKIGRDLRNLLRPDKIVAYFGSVEAVLESAERLEHIIGGTPAQVVPFTAELDKDGLLSWGIDPPSSELLLPSEGRSWRQWITDRLAVALIAGQQSSSDTLEPWQFACDRLEIEGIDTCSWTPRFANWDDYEGSIQ